MRNKSVKELRNGEFASFPVEGIMWNFSRSLWQGHLLPGSVDGGTFSEEMRNELGRADRRARLASEKRNGRWSVKNPACFHEERGQG